MDQGTGLTSMFEVFGVIVAFATIMLLLSMIITGLVQTTQATLRLRSRNLLSGIAQMMVDLKLAVPPTAPPNNEPEAKKAAARVLNRPEIALAYRVKDETSLVRKVLGPRVSWIDAKDFARVFVDQRSNNAAPASGSPVVSVVTPPTTAAAPQPPAPASSAAAPAPSLQQPAANAASVPAEPVDPRQKYIEDRFGALETQLEKRFAFRVRLLTIAWALIVAFAFQVSTPHLLGQLSRDRASRATILAKIDSLTARAEQMPVAATDSDAEKQLKELAQQRRDAVQQLATFDIRFWRDDWKFYYDSAGTGGASRGIRFEAIIGVIVTTILLSFGAPFWFNVLGNVASLRDQLTPRDEREPSDARERDKRAG